MAVWAIAASAALGAANSLMQSNSQIDSLKQQAKLKIWRLTF